MSEYLHPGYLIIVVWALWVISWLIAAVWSSRPAARPGFSAELPYRVVTAIGALLMAGGRHYFPSWPQLWPITEASSWIALAAVLGGVAFTWWARLALGMLWSSNVTRKEGHQIVDTGPYGIVRHPIYTGILFAIYATALFLGRIECLIGAALMTLGFYMKARLEEGFLVAGLGEAAYADYKKRVPMLVPFAKGWGG